MNIKSKYRIVEKLALFLGIEVYHERIKELIVDGEYPTIDSERIICYYNDALEYIKNHQKYDINKEFINRLYFLISNEKLKEETTEKIIRMSYLTLDYDDIEKAAVMMHLISKQEFKESFTLGYMLAIFILQKQKLSNLEINPNLYQVIKEAISSPNADCLIQYFRAIVRNEKAERPLKKRKEIIKTIISIKEQLIDKYRLKTMIIYGSIVKGNVHKDSDIDLIVEFESKNKIEEKEKAYKLKNELEKILKITVDIVMLDDAIKNFKNIRLIDSKRII